MRTPPRQRQSMRRISQRGGGAENVVRISAGLWWLLLPCAVATTFLPPPNSIMSSSPLLSTTQLPRTGTLRDHSEGSTWTDTVLIIRGGSESPKRKAKSKTKKKKSATTGGSTGSDASGGMEDSKVDSGSKEDRGDENSEKQGKKKKKKKTAVDDGSDATDDSSSNNNKAQINQVLKETDAAQALGDAIRARADQLRRDDSVLAGRTDFPAMDPSLSSLAWSLGASDYTGRRARSSTSTASDSVTAVDAATDEEEDSGGVEVAPGAVVASYFLKSHGGAHALQSLCSLLSATAGIGALALSSGGGGTTGASKHSAVALTLLRRSLVFALVKHVSGLLAAAWISAMAIPDVGFVRARSWMQQLALDPVSQYCFYTSLILVWLPSAASSTAKAVGATTAAPSLVSLWWQQYPFVTLLLLGPILLREVISTALVACDVLALLSLSSGGNNSSLSTTLLKIAAAVGNAGFSILVTPSVWRKASASQRQQILAKLVQKCSLAFEVAVGMLLVVDALRGAAELLFATTRPPLLNVAKRCVCANLYVQFLLTRRRKIRRLAAQIRGGAAHVPGYVLDVLLDPAAAMGIARSDVDRDINNSNNKESTRQRRRSADLAERRENGLGLTWRDYLWLALEQD